MKTCRQCGKPYTRRRTEAHWQYAKRESCSPSCQHQAQKAAATEAARATLEVLTFLAGVGVGATEAAARTGFRSRNSLDAYLRRTGHQRLLNRLIEQDYLPVVTAGPRRHLALRRAS